MIYLHLYIQLHLIAVLRILHNVYLMDKQCTYTGWTIKWILVFLLWPFLLHIVLSIALCLQVLRMIPFSHMSCDMPPCSVARTPQLSSVIFSCLTAGQTRLADLSSISKEHITILPCCAYWTSFKTQSKSSCRIPTPSLPRPLQPPVVRAGGLSFSVSAR